MEHAYSTVPGPIGATYIIIIIIIITSTTKIITIQRNLQPSLKSLV